MNREPFAQWSLDVPDASFPQALAALGVLAALDRNNMATVYERGQWRVAKFPDLFTRAFAATQGVLQWAPPDLSSSDGAPRIVFPGIRGKARRVAAPAASVLVDVWRDFIARLPARAGPAAHGPRLAVQTNPSHTLARTIEAARLLARPQAGAASVYLADVFPSDGHADWAWPFVMATLPGDPLAEPLAALQGGVGRQRNWPFHFAAASRDMPRFEILVVAAPVSNALQRLLTSGLRLHCSFVIVAGFGTDALGVAEPLLRALAARLSAEGVAVLEGGISTDDFAKRLNDFSYRLAHDQTLDVALTQAFQPDAVAMLSEDLLRISRLSTAIDRITERLRELPPQAHVPLSPLAIENLHLDQAMAGPDFPRRERSTAGAQLEGNASAIAEQIEAQRTHYRFDHESQEASAITELNRRVAEAEAALARREPTPRFVHQTSFIKAERGFVEERAGYVVGRPVLLQIYIGPQRADGIALAEPFPDHKLRGRAMHRLQVVFFEPRQLDQPMLGEILLPRSGDSKAAEFVFTPRVEGDFEARISVLHRGRVLQTALLHTSVRSTAELRSRQPGISLDPETDVRRDWSDLDTRRQFDLALVLNHSATGEALLTGVMGDKAWAKRLDSIEVPVRQINEQISTVAHSIADYGSGLDKGENPNVLVTLARIGADVYSLLYLDQLKELTTDGFDVGNESVTHVQVISARPDAVVPLEFMYDFEPPEQGATVCPQHRKALEEGRCPADCARAVNPTGHVCPLGFWGLKKVIERHLFDAKAALPTGAEVVVQVEAVDGRNRLDLSTGALVAHSVEVQDDEVQALVVVLRAQLGDNVAVVKDWDEWKAVVGDRHPTLLIAFPHNEGKGQDIRLEIGGKNLATLRLPAAYVRVPEFPAPVVFLLGCDVAGTSQEFSNHVRAFRQAGAAVVVSTIATVFGQHAVRVGETIVARLMQAGTINKVRIGEAILDAKRAALLDSVPMALCVVAFGDADWRL